MSKTSKIILWVVVGIVVIAGLWYGFSRKPASVVEKEPIKIGASLVLSGSYRKYGEKEMKGIELALDKIGKDKIKIIYEDNQADTEKAVTTVQKLINVDGVKIILGPACGSGCTLAAAPITEKADVIQIALASSHPDVANAGKKVFTLVALDNAESIALAQKLKEIGINKVAILYVNDEWGVNQKDMFVEAFKSLGGEISIIESHKREEKDFRTQLLKIKNADVDAIFFVGYDEIIEMIRQMKEMGFEKQIVSNTEVENIQSKDKLKEIGEGLIFSSQVFEFNKSIAQKFKEKFGEDIDLFAALSYDALMITYKAIEHCGGDKDTDCIANFIYGLKNYKGASGSITITPEGWRKADIVIKTIKNGKFVPYKE